MLIKKIFLLFIGLLITGSLVAQWITRTYEAPEIDGYTEEVWDQAPQYSINLPYKAEVPTVSNSCWIALYDAENFYVAVLVDDDNHWPGWQAGGENGDYDRLEIYWDVNEVLDDGKGAKDVGSGHYQFAESFDEGYYDTPVTIGKSGNNPGGIYCYSMVGEGYVYELAVPLANFNDASGISFGRGSNTVIGFDVTIIDQDEGITTTPQRMVWSNDGNGNNGSIDESWNNMDGAGEISFSYKGVPAISLSVDRITLSAESGSSASVKIYAKAPWTATSNQTWLVLTPQSGNGDDTVTITASENTGATRFGYVAYKINNYNKASIYVIQEGKVGIPVMTDNRLKFSPNPANDKILIEGGIDQVELFNSLGKMVKNTSVEGKTVSVSELPNGVYIVKAYKNGQFKGVAKIIKN